MYHRYIHIYHIYMYQSSVTYTYTYAKIDHSYVCVYITYIYTYIYICDTHVCIYISYIQMSYHMHVYIYMYLYIPPHVPTLSRLLGQTGFRSCFQLSLASWTRKASDSVSQGSGTPVEIIISAPY